MGRPYSYCVGKRKRKYSLRIIYIICRSKILSYINVYMLSTTSILALSGSAVAILGLLAFDNPEKLREVGSYVKDKTNQVHTQIKNKTNKARTIMNPTDDERDTANNTNKSTQVKKNKDTFKTQYDGRDSTGANPNGEFRNSGSTISNPNSSSTNLNRPTQGGKRKSHKRKSHKSKSRKRKTKTRR
jgi:hypothetical protein